MKMFYLLGIMVCSLLSSSANSVSRAPNDSSVACPTTGVPNVTAVKSLGRASYGPRGITIPVGTPTAAHPGNSSVLVSNVAGPDTDHIQRTINTLCGGSSDCQGKTVYFAAGVYEVNQLDIKTNLRLVGQPGTVFTGVVRLHDWREKKGSNGQLLSNTYWHTVPSGIDYNRGINTSCESGLLCKYTQTLFVNGIAVPLIDQNAFDDRKKEEWFFFNDQGDNESGNDVLIYQNKNPDFSGPNDPDVVVTMSTHYAAISDSSAWWSRHVEIENITFFGYTDHAFRTQDDWKVSHCTFRRNHFTGLRLGGKNVEINNSQFISNGRTGIEGYGSVNALVHHNEFSYNNQSGFKKGQHAGGMKTTGTMNLRAYNNYVHDNFGPGLWSDIGCVNTKYYGNYISNQNAEIKTQSIGIIYELSTGNHPTLGGSTQVSDWEIFHNVIELQSSESIFIINSSNVETYYNTLERNVKGIHLLQDARTIDRRCRSVDAPTIAECVCPTTGAMGCDYTCDQQIFNVSVRYNNISIQSPWYSKLAGFEVQCADRNGQCNKCGPTEVQQRFYTPAYHVSFDYNRYALPTTYFPDGYNVALYTEREVFVWDWEQQEQETPHHSWNDWADRQDQHSCIQEYLPSHNARQSFSIKENNQPTDLRLRKNAYPVPFDQVVHIEMESAQPLTSETHVTLIDALGKRYPVSPSQIESKEHEISVHTPDLPPGPYLLVIRTADQLRKIPVLKN